MFPFVIDRTSTRCAERHLRHSWEFALCFFVRIAHFLTKRANRSLLFLKEQITLLLFLKERFALTLFLKERINLLLFLKEQIALFKRVNRSFCFYKKRIALFFSYKSKAKRWDINLYVQFTVFSIKRSRAHS